MESPSYIANGTIEVCRFVRNDATANKEFHVVQSGANEAVIGVSQEGSLDTPGLTGSADDAARAGYPIKVYGPGQVCLLKLGTGGATAGDYLESDTNGCGVTAATTAATQRQIGAKALQTGLINEYIRVIVMPSTKTIPA